MNLVCSVKIQLGESSVLVVCSKTSMFPQPFKQKLQSLISTLDHFTLTIVIQLSFSRLECGIHDKFTFPVQTGGIFYFPWHRHQIEGTPRLLVSPPKDTEINNL